MEVFLFIFLGIGCVLLSMLGFMAGMQAHDYHPMFDTDSRFDTFIRQWPTYKIGFWLSDTPKKKERK